MRVQTLPHVDISRISNGHISVMRDAAATWLGKLVVLHVLCVLIWPWPPPRSRSRSRSVWTSENCPLLHISRSISSATFARSSKLTVDSHSTGPGLQLVGARFLNFLLGKLSRLAKLRPTSIFHKIKKPYFGTAWCYSHTVGQAGSLKCTVYLDVTLTQSKSRSRSI